MSIYNYSKSLPYAEAIWFKTAGGWTLVLGAQCLLPAQAGKVVNRNWGNAGLGGLRLQVPEPSAERTSKGTCLQRGAAAGDRAISCTSGMVSSPFARKKPGYFKLPNSCPTCHPSGVALC